MPITEPLFVGGPYDGLHIHHSIFEACGRWACYYTTEGSHDFLILPSPEHLGRDLTGDVDFFTTVRSVFVYESIERPDGEFEFIFDPPAADGGPGERLSRALATHTDPSIRTHSREDISRRVYLGGVAVELLGQLADAELRPATVIAVLRYYEDESGKRLGPERIELQERVAVTIHGSPELSAEVAAKLYRERIAQAVQFLVAGQPTGWQTPPDAPHVRLRLVDAELVVEQPEDTVGAK